MPITLKTLQNIEGLLTSDRISYKGSEILELSNILAELRNEQAAVVKALRVTKVENPPVSVDTSKDLQGS